jgi:NAD(P)H-quinone oxidoreductase subunit 5
MNQFLLHTIWLVPFYGLVGAFLTLPWSVGMIRRTGPRPAAYINLFMTLLSFLHGTIGFVQVWGEAPRQLAWHWLQAADLDLTLTIEISPISLGAMELVTFISLLAQIYALGYMEKDWSLARFFGMMGFFEGALAGIALSDSLFLSYTLLEILTLSTYLLVGFWYAQPLVVTAARDAFLTKRVGDIILLMGLVALSSYGAGLNFSQLEDWAATTPLEPWVAAALGLSLIAGPTGKCAQFPLNLWLDEAMEGPNPAGILRNSVVVSAGAYVLIKLEPVFTLSPVSADALLVIGSLTVVGASLMAIAQIDIKRTLSHSTSAYLGLVFIAVGLGHVDIALLLLFSHAIAKALLFMSAGSIIMTTSGQNITEMGGLWSRMPATTTAFLVGSTGLLAIAPLGMFWTMHRWLDGTWSHSGWLVGVLAFANFTSAVNLVRVFRLVFLGTPQAKTRRAPEVPWPMAIPMVTLSIGTVAAYAVPHHWQFWLSPITPLSQPEGLVAQIAFPIVMGAGILGSGVGFAIQLRRAWSRPAQVSLRFLQDLFAYDFYIERIYNVTVVAAVSGLSRLSDWVDRYVIDGAVNLVGLVTIFSGQGLRYNTSGQFRFYALTILLGVGLLLLVTVNLPS